MEEIVKAVLNGNTTPIVAFFFGFAVMYRKFIKVEIGLDVLKEKVDYIKTNCGQCDLQRMSDGRRPYDKG